MMLVKRLYVVLTAQFDSYDYTSGHVVIVLGGKDSYYEGEFGLGDMFQTIYPDWQDDEKYDMDWGLVCENPERYRKFDYDAVADFRAA